MDTTNLAKWVDELQAQIDLLKITGGDDAAIKTRVSALETQMQSVEALPFIVSVSETVTLDADADEITVTFDPIPYTSTDYDMQIIKSYNTGDSTDGYFSMSDTTGTVGVIGGAKSSGGTVTVTGTSGLITMTLSANEGATTPTMVIAVDDGDKAGFVDGAAITATLNFILTKKPAEADTNNRSRKKK